MQGLPAHAKNIYTQWNSHKNNFTWLPQNIWAIMAKIVTKKCHTCSMVIFWIKVRGIYQDLRSQADPVRESWTWSYP